MEILVNIESIQVVEGGSETVITLVNGEKLHVKNHPQDIVDKIRAHRIGLHAEAELGRAKTRKKE